MKRIYEHGIDRLSNQSKVTRAAVVGMLALASISANATPVQAGEVERLAGSNRYETAAEVSRSSFPQAESANAVVVVSGEQYPDALAAGPVAASHVAPILLTNANAMPQVSMDEANRAARSYHDTAVSSEPYQVAYIVGGEAVVGEQVVDQLEANDFRVIRIAGANRVETSLEVAEFLRNKGIEDYRFLVDGTDPSQAQVATMTASHYNLRENNQVVDNQSTAGGFGSVLYTNDDQLSQGVRELLDSQDQTTATYAIGSMAVTATADFRYIRDIEGDDAITTSLGVVERLYGESNEAYMQNVAITAIDGSGAWADSLAAAPNAGFFGNALPLFTYVDTLPNRVAEYLMDASPSHAGATLYGGTATISTQVEERIQDLTE